MTVVRTEAQPSKFEAKLTNAGNTLSRNVRKIAVLRANSPGDFILALPALQALRESYPHAEIILLGRAWHAEFLQDRPSPVDRVVIIPPIRGIYDPDVVEEDPNEVKRFFDAMAEEAFDLAIQVHGDGRYSNPFIQRLGARLSIGAKNPDAVPLDLWVPYTTNQSEILRHLEVISLVGARAGNLEPRISVTKRDLEEAASYLPPGGRQVIALSPGGENETQHWPVEKYARVAESLSTTGARIAIIGNQKDSPLAERIMTLMSQPADNLCGRLSLRGLAGFLSRCRLVIANNSDFLRLAWAVNAPTVGIFWLGNLINSGPLNRAKHRIAVSWRMNCPICGTNLSSMRCSHISSYTEDITTVEVLSSALELLAQKSWPGLPILPNPGSEQIN